MGDRSQARLDWPGTDSWRREASPEANYPGNAFSPTALALQPVSPHGRNEFRPDRSSAEIAGLAASNHSSMHGSHNGSPQHHRGPSDPHALVPVVADNGPSWTSSGSTRSAEVGVVPPPDGETAYKMWLQSQAGGVPNGVEKKVFELSRRTAAELRRVEKERTEHERRLEALEQLCQQHLSALDVRLGQSRDEACAEVEQVAQRVRGRFERDLRQATETLHEQCGDLRSSAEHMSDALRALAKRVDANHTSLEEMRTWRGEAVRQLASCAEAINDVARNSASSVKSSYSGDIAERVEEQLEAALVRERKQAHERLRSSCAEMTAHLNDLRQELVEQRRVLESTAEDLDGRRERLQREIAAHMSDLETQIAELGGALATRMQAKLDSMTKKFNDRIDIDVKRNLQELLQHSLDALAERTASLESNNEWLSGQAQIWRRENTELHALLSILQDHVDPSKGDSKFLEAARDEARTVHLEVMSVNARVAALEEARGIRRRESVAVEDRMTEDTGRWQSLLRGEVGTSSVVGMHASVG